MYSDFSVKLSNVDNQLEERDNLSNCLSIEYQLLYLILLFREFEEECS